MCSGDAWNIHTTKVSNCQSKVGFFDVVFVKIHAHSPHLGRRVRLEKLGAENYLRGGGEDKDERSLDATDEPEMKGDESVTMKPKSSMKAKQKKT